MKVAYIANDGHQRTAYLDTPALADGSYVGTNKHTDEFVHVKWSNKEKAWLTVCERVYGPYNPYTDESPEIIEQRPPCTCWSPDAEGE
jgi:hypothetical protein